MSAGSTVPAATSSFTIIKGNPLKVLVLCHWLWSDCHSKCLTTFIERIPNQSWWCSNSGKMNQDVFHWFQFVSVKFEWSVFCNNKITDSANSVWWLWQERHSGCFWLNKKDFYPYTSFASEPFDFQNRVTNGIGWKPHQCDGTTLQDPHMSSVMLQPAISSMVENPLVFTVAT